MRFSVAQLIVFVTIAALSIAFRTIGVIGLVAACLAGSLIRRKLAGEPLELAEAEK